MYRVIPWIKWSIYVYICLYVNIWIDEIWKKIYIYIWVNYNISLTWINAIWGWFPLLTMIPVRSQWGRYNLPRYLYSHELPDLQAFASAAAKPSERSRPLRFFMVNSPCFHGNITVFNGNIWENTGNYGNIWEHQRFSAKNIYWTHYNRLSC